MAHRGRAGGLSLSPSPGPGRRYSQTHSPPPPPVSARGGLTPRSGSAVVQLNVGGKLFATTLTTLGAVEGSRLGRMFSEHGDVGIPLLRDTDGNLFIDRDPRPFGDLLNFCRDGECHIPSDPDARSRLKREAEFFALDALVKRIDAASASYGAGGGGGAGISASGGFGAAEGWGLAGSGAGPGSATPADGRRRTGSDTGGGGAALSGTDSEDELGGGGIAPAPGAAGGGPGGGGGAGGSAAGSSDGERLAASKALQAARDAVQHLTTRCADAGARLERLCLAVQNRDMGDHCSRLVNNVLAALRTVAASGGSEMLLWLRVFPPESLNALPSSALPRGYHLANGRDMKVAGMYGHLLDGNGLMLLVHRLRACGLCFEQVKGTRMVATRSESGRATDTYEEIPMLRFHLVRSAARVVSFAAADGGGGVAGDALASGAYPTSLAGVLTADLAELLHLFRSAISSEECFGVPAHSLWMRQRLDDAPRRGGVRGVS